MSQANAINPEPGTQKRPIGNLWSFVQDVKARGFVPRGIIDVGAHHGGWTRAALGIYPGTPVIMIEPLDEMELHLSKMVEDHPSCRYVKAGAGRQDGTQLQTIWDDLTGCSFLPAADPDEIQRPTEVRTIDGILEALPDFHPDFVKLDTQGYELEALSGATTLFGRTELFIVETLLYEFMPKLPITREVIGFMGERGYEIYDVTELHRRPFDGALAHIDFAFVKRNGRFRTSNEW
jgi:FkbM family methyltransferase